MNIDSILIFSFCKSQFDEVWVDLLVLCPRCLLETKRFVELIYFTRSLLNCKPWRLCDIDLFRLKDYSKILISHLNEISTSLDYMPMLPLVEQSPILLLEQILQRSRALFFEEILELLIFLYVLLSTHQHCVLA